MATTDRTNVTDNGYTYNGQNFTNQTRTDSQGNSYNVAIQSAIPTSSLQGTAPIVPTTPQYTDFSGNTAQQSAYVNNASDAATQTALAEQKYNETNQNAFNQNSAISTLLSAQGNKSADASANMQATGASTLAGDIRKLQAQSNALSMDTQAKTLAEQNKATGQNITGAAVQRNTADATRENFINQANIAMQVAIKQADYTTAKDLADQMTNAKYDKIEADIKAAQNNLTAYKDYFVTPAQKKAADAQSALLKKQEQDIADKKAEEKQVNDMLIQASPVAPPDVLARAKDIQAKGGSATQVAMALGQYGGDFLKNQLLKEQLKTELSQRSKIASDIAVNNAQIRNYNASASKTKAETESITGPNGVISKPLTDVQAKDLLYAQRGEQADSIIGNLQNTVVSMNPTSFATQKALESSSLTSGQVSNEIRQLRQAERNFATAVLRKESGAAISPTEFATVEKQYFPRPGDDTQTLAQKKMNRETYISGTKSGVPGYDQRVTTPESSYLDSVDASLKVVEQKTTPVSIYTSRLLGLPGVKP